MSASEFLLWELRRRREAEGLSQDEWGSRVYFSPQHVSAVERGTRPAKADYLGAVDKEFGTSLAVFYETFVKNELAPAWLRPWLEYEEKAVALRLYGTLVIPGLFQTERYARMVLSSGPLQPDEVERSVQLRMSRQSILDRKDPPQFSCLVEELTLRRGESDVLPEQLRHLVALAERPNITIQVIPVDAPAHLGWGGPLELASFIDGEDVGYLDNHLEGQTVTSPNQIATLGTVWDSVGAVALPARQSLNLIKEVANSWS
ncbi:helix-turn-helix domain-containing protein [Plantactinospora soyae]|uniref:Transcriptional regulator with XRE-family HTH domain n=1 Tax=Plantactinospora soyae TaxID=1544732 RepID=A0A927M1R6_9ACTN|nr:helix-turn-helix transcriptional regulator [Plantactinospora soyae]MBE1486034.1 transcriptional regulator with XRE-family HTH domain [Plantactinospora soyae]